MTDKADLRYSIGNRETVHSGYCGNYHRHRDNINLLPKGTKVTCTMCNQNERLVRRRRHLQKKYPYFSWAMICTMAADPNRFAD